MPLPFQTGRSERTRVAHCPTLIGACGRNSNRFQATSDRKISVLICVHLWLLVSEAFGSLWKASGGVRQFVVGTPRCGVRASRRNAPTISDGALGAHACGTSPYLA